jgi:hypothetical protein
MATIQLSKTNTQVGFKSGDGGWGAGMALFQRTMDALVMPTAIDKDVDTPPATNNPGDMFILNANNLGGAWGGKSQQLAVYVAGDDIQAGWIFLAPREGWRVWVSDEDKFYTFNGSAWATEAAASVDLSIVPVVNNALTAFTLTAAHRGSMIRHANGDAITMTIPVDLATPIGATGSHRQVSSGQVTIVPAAGVTLNVPTGFAAKTARQGSVLMWHKVDNNIFDLTGDLAAA